MDEDLDMQTDAVFGFLPDIRLEVASRLPSTLHILWVHAQRMDNLPSFVEDPGEAASRLASVDSVSSRACHTAVADGLAAGIAKGHDLAEAPVVHCELLSLVVAAVRVANEISGLQKYCLWRLISACCVSIQVGRSS